MGTTSQFQRARSHDAKQQRERAILEAASALALHHGVRSVTLTDIAQHVGLHKSAMLRYFETREQIFLRLAAEGWREWVTAVQPGLEAARDLPGPAIRARQVARTMAETLWARPLFCDLLAQAPLNLERNVSLESARTTKRSIMADLQHVADELRNCLGLSQEEALNATATATAMAGALWQMAALGTPLRDLYESDPELRCAVVDGPAQLTDIMTGLLTGYLAGHHPASQT